MFKPIGKDKKLFLNVYIIIFLHIILILAHILYIYSDKVHVSSHGKKNHIKRQTHEKKGFD